MKQSDNFESFLKPIAWLVLIAPPAALLIACGLMWQGFVLQHLWVWFIVPSFALPAVSLPVAIGISLTVGLITSKHIPQDKDESKWIPFVRMFITPALFLLSGWIVTRFI